MSTAPRKPLPDRYGAFEEPYRTLFAQEDRLRRMERIAKKYLRRYKRYPRSGKHWQAFREVREALSDILSA
jgi:hypothetical protein